MPRFIRDFYIFFVFFFFFQAEDGIRDWSVTGVQTCALPISAGQHAVVVAGMGIALVVTVVMVVVMGVTVAMALAMRMRVALGLLAGRRGLEIGRASCRERV